ncbi:MFS transporter [uncultured Phenylobacterium sp.]|uniref:MFS transporter n=1 Tax=uncultured Phenylobacterium sp. TaxID=349273 RepID=UPI0025DD11F3|nr:MFS transporter [uncultured Phenylobacterium sp.]
MATKGKPTVAVGVLSLPAVLAFASVSIPIAALQLAISVHLPRYFASSIGIELAVVGAAFGLVRLIDIPIDAGIGVAMDRTRTAFGRYRVWMLGGAPILMIGLYMLLAAPDGVGLGYLVVWLLVMYLGYSGVYLAHLAWAGRLAPTYDQRSRVFGGVTGLGVVGAMAVLLIPIVMGEAGYSEAEGVRAMIWFIIAAVPVTAFVVLASTRETIAKDHSASFKARDYISLLTRGNVLRILAADFFVTLGPGWMAALYLFYFRDSRGFSIAEANILLMVYVAAGFAGAPFTAWMANRISKHRALILNTTVYSIGLSALPFLPPGSFAVFVPFMFALGAMQSGFTVMIRALAGDIADELRLESGREWMGLVYAVINATTKLAQAGAVLFTFNFALTAVGYQAKAGAVNTPEAIRGLELAYVVGPVVFVMIAGSCFLGYRLSPSRHEDIRRQLAERDAIAAGANLAETLAGDPQFPPARS